MLPYFDPEYENFNQRINPPRVCIDNTTCSDCTLVKVDSMNKNGILLEVLQVLSDLDLHIFKAYITSDGGWFMDVFHVVDKQGKKVTDDKTIKYIEKALGPESNLLGAKAGSNSPGRSVGLHSIGDHTAIELKGPDRTGLLSEIFAVLADLQCNVLAAEMWTHRMRVACVVYVNDVTTGQAIDDPCRVSRIETRLRHVLRGYGHGGGRVGAAPRGPAAAPAHARRRGHRRRRRRRRRRRGGGRRGGRQAGGDGGALRGEVLLGGERQVQGPVQAAVRHRVHAHRHALRRVPRRRLLRGQLRHPGALHPPQGRQDASERRSGEGDQVPRSRHLQTSIRGLHAGAVRAGPGGPAVGRDAGAPGARADGGARRRDDGGRAGHQRVLRAQPVGAAGGHEDHRGAPGAGGADPHAQRQERPGQGAGAGLRLRRRGQGQGQLLLLRQPLRQAPGLINSIRPCRVPIV